MRITIGRKIAIGFTIILVLMIIMGIGAYYALNTFNETADNVKKACLELEGIDRLRTPLLEALVINDYFVMGDIEKKGDFDILSVEVEDAIRQLEELPHLVKNERAYVDRIKKNFAVLKTKSDEIQKLADLTKKEFAGPQINKLVEEINAVSLSLVEDMEGLHKYIEDEIPESINYMKRAKISGIYTIITTTLLAILLSILIGFVLTRGITKPVLALTNAVKHIAKGDLAQKIEVKSHDEIGDLSNAFNRMVRDLRESRARLDNIIESSLDCIVVTDAKGYITRINKSFLKMLGYKEEEEVIGKHVGELSPSREGTYESTTGEMIDINKDYLDGSKAMMSRLSNEGRINNWESCIINKEKKVVSTEQNVVYLYNEEGETIGAVGIIRDITERKRAEKELKDSRDFLENIFETTADAIMVVDQNGYVVRGNKAAEKMLGYPQEEIIGKHMKELTITDESTVKAKDKLMVSLQEEGFVGNFEHVWLKKDGSLLPVEQNITYLEDRDGNKRWFVLATRDISERKWAEKKLMEYQNQLKSLASQLTLIEERERRRFATFLHDQIGQTLFIAKIKLEMLRESSSSTDIVKSSDEILKIIEQIIKDTRSLTFELSPPILYQLGLEAALEWLVEQMKEQYGVIVNFEDDKQPKPLNDDILILLFQAVRELLINVSKHAEARKVKVSIGRDGEDLRIRVEDDGVGFITSEIGSSRHKSKGFGLFSIKERLDHLGGSLEIESKPDQGTRITLVAPLTTS